jgi:hypothetical protein
MVIAHVTPKDFNHAMCVNPLSINMMKMVQIPSGWNEEIPRIDEAWRNADPAPVDISEVNE